MTIQVESTTHPETPEAAPGGEGKAPGGAALSAQGGTPPEQKTPAESDPAEPKDQTEEDGSETEASDEPAAESDEPKNDPPAKKKGGFQKRIDKLNARVAEKEREANYWREQALAGKPAAAPEPKPAADPKTPKDGRPDPDKFESHADYIEAVADWKTEQMLKERDEKAQKANAQSAQEQKLRAHYDREKSFQAKTADYAEVMEEVSHLRDASPALAEAIVTSDHGPALMYELAKNPTEYARINALPAVAAVRELGRIEAKIAGQGQEAPQPKKLTSAPPPVNPVGSKGGSVEKSIYDPNLTQAEYEALRAKQRKAASG